MAARRLLLALAAGVATAVSMLALGLYNYYVFFLNGTGHTGIDVKQVASAYAIQAAVSALVLRFEKHRAVMLCLAAGLLGAIEIFAFDLLGVMSSYDDWARQGLQARTFGCWFLKCG